MRSQKRVRRIGKVRCLKNAAAGKWKTYRRRLEARKAWQNNTILTEHQHSCNTLAPPPPTYRKIKEMKQRSPEELAEREQRRLEKKLAKQKASTSTLPEIRKEKKLKEASSNGSPKKASDEPKTVAKMIKTKNSMIKATAKNGQEQRTINVTQREVAAKNVDESKVIKVPKLGNGSKPKYQYLKEERSVSTEEGKRKKPSSPIKREQKELVQSKKIANENGQNEVHASAGKIEEISKEQKKKKRSRRSDPDSLLSEHDFVEGNDHGMGYEEAKADFTEIMGRRQKKKGRHRDEQQSKSEQFTGKTKKQEEDILEQIEKQEEDISGKKENKGLNEAMAYLVKDQSSTLESTGFKTEKITDHMTFGSDNIPKDSEILSKTEIITEASIPKGLEINVERLAEEHPEPLGATNLNFGGNVTGNITTTSAKEAKYDVGAEKKEPVVLVSQTDKVSHIMPTHERMCKLLPRDIQFCVHMIEKHGEDYETMAKDHGNVFRDSAKGIARKIRIFKESPQYETYLKQKAEKNGSVA